MNLKNMEDVVLNIDRYYEKELQKKEMARKIYEEEKEKEESLMEDLDKKIIRKEFLDKVSDAGRENSRKLFESLMSEALQMSFGSQKAVELEIKKRDGVPAATILINTPIGKDDILSIDPSNGSGGVRDIISIAALLSMRMLWRPNNKAPLFLDEPFKNLSREYAEPISSFMEKITESNSQTFIVTHERAVMPNMADKTFLVVKEDGCSKVLNYKE